MTPNPYERLTVKRKKYVDRIIVSGDPLDAAKYAGYADPQKAKKANLASLEVRAAIEYREAELSEDHAVMEQMKFLKRDHLAVKLEKLRERASKARKPLPNAQVELRAIDLTAKVLGYYKLPPHTSGVPIEPDSDDQDEPKAAPDFGSMSDLQLRRLLGFGEGAK